MTQLKSLKDIFQTNPIYEKEGFILDFSVFRVRLARAGGSNTDFAKAFERHTRDIRAAIRRKQVDADVSDQRMVLVFADSVVKDWETNVGTAKEPMFERGINIDGSLLPFNRENVIRALTELKELFAVIQESAQDIDNFRDEGDKEDDLGN